MHWGIGDLCVCYGDICIVLNKKGINMDVLMDGTIIQVQADWCQKLTKEAILRRY